MTAHAPSTPSHGLVSAIGQRHSNNQDAALAGPDWFVVADGMGGHTAGAVASRVVIQTFAETPCNDTGRDGLTTAIARACDHANLAVIRRAARDGTYGMGSTVVGIVPDAGGAIVFHVGDSRCYRLVEGELRLLTRDHSHVQELIDAGRLTTEQARHHPRRSVVTRAIGLDATLDADIVRVDARPSRFLLCTATPTTTSRRSSSTTGRSATMIRPAPATTTSLHRYDRHFHTPTRRVLR